MSEALRRWWKETSISVILRPTLIDDSSFIFCQFFWEAQLTERSSAMKGEPFQDLPGILKVPGLSGEVWERKVWWYQLLLVLSDPFQFLINPSWVCQARSCKSKQLWWKSSVPLKLNLCAEILFIGGFLMQKWGKNTHWNLHSSPNPVPYVDLLFPCTTQKMFPISRVVLHTKCCWFLSDEYKQVRT